MSCGFSIAWQRLALWKQCVGR